VGDETSELGWDCFPPKKFLITDEINQKIKIRVATDLANVNHSSGEFAICGAHSITLPYSHFAAGLAPR